MPKQPADTSKLAVATPPNANPKLADYLKASGPSAKPPSTGGRSTGGIPTNRPRGGKR